MARREFSNPVKAQIVRRATLQNGEVACEGCGLILGKKPFDIDHTIPDAMFLDKSRKLTADDGKLLGKQCCHDPKTHEIDIPTIAKVKRVEAKHTGVTKPSGKFPKPAKAARHAKDGLKPLDYRKLYREVTT